MLACELVHSAPASAKPPEDGQTQVDPAAREKSRAAFRKGVGQLRAQDWAGARASFEEAWSLVQHPSILLNLGIARLRTDDPVLAEQDLVRFLSEDSGAAPEELASAREALNEARSKIGTLRVVISPASARVVVDGKAIAVRAPPEGNTEGVAEARLKAGKHTLAVEAEGFAPNQRAVDVAAKSDAEVRVTLAAKDAGGGKVIAPAPGHDDGPTTRKIVGWSLGGVAGAALVVSGVMALRAMSLSSDYGDASKPSFQDPDVKSEGITFRTGADVSLVIALLAGAGAVVLLFTDVGSQQLASSSPANLKSSTRASTPFFTGRSPLQLRW